MPRLRQWATIQELRSQAQGGASLNAAWTGGQTRSRGSWARAQGRPPGGLDQAWPGVRAFPKDSIRQPPAGQLAATWRAPVWEMQAWGHVGSRGIRRIGGWSLGITWPQTQEQKDHRGQSCVGEVMTKPLEEGLCPEDAAGGTPLARETQPTGLSRPRGSEHPGRGTLKLLLLKACERGCLGQRPVLPPPGVCRTDVVLATWP